MHVSSHQLLFWITYKFVYSYSDLDNQLEQSLQILIAIGLYSEEFDCSLTAILVEAKILVLQTRFFAEFGKDLDLVILVSGEPVELVEFNDCPWSDVLPDRVEDAFCWNVHITINMKECYSFLFRLFHNFCFEQGESGGKPPFVKSSISHNLQGHIVFILELVLKRERTFRVYSVPVFR